MQRFLLFVPMVHLMYKGFLCASAIKKRLKLKTAYLKLPTKFLDVLQSYEMP